MDYSLFDPDSKYSNPEDAKIFYAYYGSLSEIDFLKQLYSLNKMDSIDSEFSNAEQEIVERTVQNSDWEYGWVFRDCRFGLTDGDDNTLLDFLCAVFNPKNRNENGYWKNYLQRIQELLHADGYELYVSEFISGRAVYNWRQLTDAEKNSDTFLPFSIRYYKCKFQLPKICKSKRKALIELMAQFETREYHCTDTGFNVLKSTRDAIVDDLNSYYNNTVQERLLFNRNFDKLVLELPTKCLFDIIELYSKYTRNTFANRVNELLWDIGYAIADCKIMPMLPQVKIKTPIEPDLKDLIHLAESYYQQHDSLSMQNALEKIWDAFERIKTHNSSDKKKSLQTIIGSIASNGTELYVLVNKEFAELSNIGNHYKIRHFEKGKLDIPDDRVKEYLYMRCSAIINLAIKYIDKK